MRTSTCSLTKPNTHLDEMDVAANAPLDVSALLQHVLQGQRVEFLQLHQLQGGTQLRGKV